MSPISLRLLKDIKNLRARLRISDALPNREDIVRHGANLIAFQDGKMVLADIELSREEMTLGHDIGRLMKHPANPEEEQAPAGTKLPPLYFSPLYHFYYAFQARPVACTYPPPSMPQLPRTVRELETYLHEVMLGVFENTDRFEKSMGTSISSIAQFLYAIRGTHPALFLLLLSFEVEIVARFMPCLGYRGGRNEAEEWRSVHFQNAKGSILTIFEAMRILRRGTLIINTVSVRHRLTAGHLKTLVSKLRANACHPSHQRALTEANFSAYAIRKTMLIDIDRHDAVRGQIGGVTFQRGSTDTDTLLAYTSLHNSDASYAADVLEDYIDNAISNLPVAGPPQSASPAHSAIAVERISGAGKRQDDRLATFYGLTGEEIATLVAIEIGELVRNGMTKRSKAAPANALLDNLWEGANEIRCPHIDSMTELAPYVFPPKGRFRHSCGFAASSWSDLNADASYWRRLTEGREKEGNADNSYTELFLSTRRYLHGFSFELVRMVGLEEAAQLFCHLAQGVGLLSQDPIWIRLIDRTKMLAGINLKNTTFKQRRSVKFGRGPKSLGQLVRTII